MKDTIRLENNKSQETQYNFSKEFFLKFIFQIYFGLLIFLCIIYSDNTSFILFLILSYILYSMYIVNFEPLNPVIWLLPFMYLYHFSVILLDKFNIRNVSFEGDILLIGWTAIFTVSTILIIGCKKNIIPPTKKIQVFKNELGMKLFFIVLVILSLLHNIFFLASGLSSKSEASLSGFNTLQFVHLWFITLYSIILVKKYLIDKKPSGKFVLFAFSLSLITTLNLGQRDVFLSYLVITIFIFYLYYKPKRVLVYLMAIITLFIIPILGETKNLFTRSQLNISFDNLFLDLISGEFLSAGRNIETLLKFSDQWDSFYGLTYIWDIVRTIVPGIIYSTQNSVGWFNNTFHASRVMEGYGLGFALSGEGYINFGLIGVFITYVFYGLVLVYLYNLSSKRIITFIIYINAIPFFIYSLRADFSNLFSPLLKSVLLPMLIIFILNEILNQYYKKEKKMIKIKKYA